MEANSNKTACKYVYNLISYRWIGNFEKKNASKWKLKRLIFGFFKNPAEANSRSKIFLFSLLYVCMYLCIYVCHASWRNEKRYRPVIWYTYSPRPYLKRVFLLFRKNYPGAARLEKLQFHVDFSHISSIALFDFWLEFFLIEFFSLQIRIPGIDSVLYLKFHRQEMANFSWLTL